MTDSREEKENLWFLPASPAIWAAHFLGSYATAALWCGKLAGHDGLGPLRLALALYTVVALAGIAATVYTGSGNPSMGAGLELDAIAVVVIGGTLLTGGRGHVAGTLLGLLIFGTIQSAILFDGRLSSWWMRIVVGGLLLVFILLQRLLVRKAGRAS